MSASTQGSHREDDRRARAYVLGTTAAGLAVLIYSALDLTRHSVGLNWLVLLALTVLSGWATLRIPAMPISFSISDIFIMAAGLLFGPAAGAVTAALDAAVLSSRMAANIRTLGRVLFNVATPALSMWVATQLFVALRGHLISLDGPWGALHLLAVLAVFGFVDFGLNTGIVAMAVSFERKVPVWIIWRDHFLTLWVSYFGGVFGAMLLLVLTRSNRLNVLLLIVPLPVILYITFRHAVGRATDQIDHLAKVNKVYVGAIEALAHAVDAKDEVTHDHTRRVQDRSVALARALGVNDEGEIQAIKAASLLHDVGKLAIPEHILNKPGRLTPAEYDIMKRHAAIGADILSVIGFPFAVAPIVRSHHENWDGTGYPDGVAREKIPVGSRILAVVDCFDALTSDRPYRPRMSDEDALQIIGERSGTMYDPRVVDAFFALHGSDLAVVAVPAAPDKPHSALQAPVRTGEEHRADLEPQTFFEFGRAIGSPASAEALGDALWAQFRLRLPASLFVLYGYERADDSIVALYEVPAAPFSVFARRIPLGERLSGWVAATGQTVVNSDARLDLDEDVREQSPLRSALAVPVLSSDRPIAVLSLYAETPAAFDEVHRRLVTVVAGSVAPIIARLRADAIAAPPPAPALQNSTRV